jgi:hypothetical protein
MLSPRFLRLYGEKCRRSAQSMTDPRSVAESEAMARDLEDWANDPDPQPSANELSFQ